MGLRECIRNNGESNGKHHAKRQRELLYRSLYDSWSFVEGLGLMRVEDLRGFGRTPRA